MFGLIVTEQYVSPAIVNSYGAFNELQYLQALERLLKLSVPTLWGWLVVFYTLFHLLLNITAEFTGFGDREFYLVSSSCCSSLNCLLLLCWAGDQATVSHYSRIDRLGDNFTSVMELAVSCVSVKHTLGRHSSYAKVLAVVS